MLKEILETLKSDEFEYTMKINLSDVKKLTKKLGFTEDIQDGVFTYYDKGIHIMTYNNELGELYSDSTPKEIEAILR